MTPSAYNAAATRVWSRVTSRRTCRRRAGAVATDAVASLAATHDEWRGCCSGETPELARRRCEVCNASSAPDAANTLQHFRCNATFAMARPCRTLYRLCGAEDCIFLARISAQKGTCGVFSRNLFPRSAVKFVVDFCKRDCFHGPGA